MTTTGTTGSWWIVVEIDTAVAVGVVVMQGEIMFRRGSTDGSRKFGCIHS